MHKRLPAIPFCVLLIACTVGAAPHRTPVSTAKARCHFRDAGIVRRTDEAVIASTAHRVYTRRSHIPAGQYIGCVRRTGRVTQLTGYQDIVNYARLTGHIAATATWPNCEGCDFSDAFRVVDLSSGRRIYSNFGDNTYLSAIYKFSDVALAHSGSFAAIRTRWRISDYAKSRRVVYFPRGGRKVFLDRGMVIGPTSLRRIGGTYYWRHGKGMRSFTP